MVISALTAISQPWALPLPGLVGRQLRGYPPELPGVEVLSDREQAIWQRWSPSSPRRREWFWGRVVAKEAVAQCIALYGGRSRSLTAIEILPSPLGQPQVICAGLAPQDWPTVSISHVQTQVVAVAALPPVPIGIDIEPLGRVRGDDLKALAFTPLDLACLPAPATDPTYLALWAAKEAAAKAAGTGLQGRPADWRVLSYRPTESPGCHFVDIGHRDRQFSTLVWAEGPTINAFCHPHVPRYPR